MQARRAGQGQAGQGRLRQGEVKRGEGKWQQFLFSVHQHPNDFFPRVIAPFTGIIVVVVVVVRYTLNVE